MLFTNLHNLLRGIAEPLLSFIGGKIFGFIIEVQTIKEIMSYESALVEGAKLAIFVGKRLEEKEREELIDKAEAAEAARAAKAKAAEKKAAPKTRKPRTKKTAEADEKTSKKASTK